MFKRLQACGTFFLRKSLAAGPLSKEGFVPRGAFCMYRIPVFSMSLIRFVPSELAAIDSADCRASERSLITGKSLLGKRWLGGPQLLCRVERKTGSTRSHQPQEGSKRGQLDWRQIS